MKKIWKLAICLVLSVGVVACSSQDSERETPSSVVENYMKAMKAQDTKGMAKYTKSGLGEDFGITEKDEAEMNMNKEQIQKLFDTMMKFEYTMGKEAIDGDNASVSVDIQAIDMNAIMEDFGVTRKDEIAQIVASDMSQEEMNSKIFDIMFEEIAKASMEHTQTYTFQVELLEDSWKVDDSSDDFYTTITGGR